MRIQQTSNRNLTGNEPAHSVVRIDGRSGIARRLRKLAGGNLYDGERLRTIASDLLSELGSVSPPVMGQVERAATTQLMLEKATTRALQDGTESPEVVRLSNLLHRQLRGLKASCRPSVAQSLR